MKAIFKHELASYFSSVTAFVFGAFLLLFTGIYTMSICISSASASFEYVLYYVGFVFLIIVPVLTMRVISEERKQKTDQLLYSLPLSMTQVVMGKYLALLVVFAVPMLIICLYPLVLSAFGSVYLPEAYGTILGFFLLGASLIAIGMFISSLTESQAVSAGLCFAVMLLNYFISSLASFVSSDAYASFVAFAILVLLLGLVVWLMTKNSFAAWVTIVVLEVALTAYYLLFQDSFAGLFAEVMEGMSLYERFYQFVYGVFDITAIVYFLTVIGVFLFLCVQSMEKRRWSE